MNAASRNQKDVFAVVGNLTVRELEVLCLLGQGKDKKEIARETGVSWKDVDHHCTAIQLKLHLQDGVALLRFAAQWVIGDFLYIPQAKTAVVLPPCDNAGKKKENYETPNPIHCSQPR